MDSHETLGVAPDATAEEITKAYRRLARSLHPDVHPGSTPEERTQYKTAMARVNDAYRRITSQVDPRRPRRTTTWRPRDGRGPGPHECSMCGHAPAASLAFEYQEGVLFSRRRYSLRSTLCRDCSRAVGRSHQDRTLRRGLWGPTLFVANIGVVSRNARALRRAHSLGEPAPVSGVTAPLGTPMPPGNPVALRVGFWVLPLVVALVVCIWAGAHTGDPPPTPSGGRFTPGTCLVGSATVTAVPCSESHSAEIVAVADRPASCPAVAQAYLDDGKQVLCVRSLP